MKKDLNIVEGKRVCRRRVIEPKEQMSGWMYELPLTEEQKKAQEQHREEMRQRYIAAGMTTSS